MRVFTEELRHPTQASRVLLRIFSPPEGGFLALETWDGTSPVSKTLGLFDVEEEARGRVLERGRQLEREGFSRVAPAA
jgi:hypothetical protein